MRDFPAFKDNLEVEMSRLIAGGGAVKVQMAQPEEVEKLCGTFPDYLPKNKEARVVTVCGELGCPCSGE